MIIAFPKFGEVARRRSRRMEITRGTIICRTSVRLPMDSEQTFVEVNLFELLPAITPDYG